MDRRQEIRNNLADLIEKGDAIVPRVAYGTYMTIKGGEVCACALGKAVIATIGHVPDFITIGYWIDDGLLLIDFLEYLENFIPGILGEVQTVHDVMVMSDAGKPISLIVASLRAGR